MTQYLIKKKRVGFPFKQNDSSSFHTHFLNQQITL